MPAAQINHIARAHLAHCIQQVQSGPQPQIPEPCIGSGIPVGLDNLTAHADGSGSGPPSPRPVDGLGLVFGMAVTEGLSSCSGALPSSSDSGGSPRMTRWISAPVRVSYSKRPYARRFHSSFFSVRMEWAFS